MSARSIFLWSCLALLAHVDVSAKMIRVQFVAEVGDVDDYDGLLGGTVVPGGRITGFFQYDTTTPNSSSSPESRGQYVHTTAPFGVRAEVGGHVFETDPKNVEFYLGVSNDNGNPPIDLYALSSYRNRPVAGDVIVEAIEWGLTDATSEALSSVAPPRDVPAIESWTSSYVWIQGYQDRTGKSFRLDAIVTKVELAPICDTALRFGSGELRMDFVLGVPSAARWSAKFFASTEVFPMWTLDLPRLHPPIELSVPMRHLPEIGTVGVFVTLSDQELGITCSEWRVIDTRAGHTQQPLAPASLENTRAAPGRR